MFWKGDKKSEMDTGEEKWGGLTTGQTNKMIGKNGDKA
jgi:hypothetical protein